MSMANLVKITRKDGARILAWLLVAFVVCAAPGAARAAEDGAGGPCSLEPTPQDRAAWFQKKEARRLRKIQLLAQRAPVAEQAPSAVDQEIQASPAPDRYSPALGVEDFEGGSWSGSGYWWTGDSNPASGTVYWDDCSPGQGCPVTPDGGDWHAWCADQNWSPWDQYENDMDAYMYTECEYLGTSSGGDNALYYSLWVETEASVDYFEYTIDGYYADPGHNVTGTPDATWTYRYPNASSSGWSHRSVHLPAAFDGCLYIRITYKFHSDASVCTAQGAYLDNIHFHDLADTAVYPIKGGFVGSADLPRIVQAVHSYATLDAGEWGYIAFWDGENMGWTDWFQDGPVAFAWPVPFDQAVSCWLYLNSRGTWVECVQGYKWDLR